MIDVNPCNTLGARPQQKRQRQRCFLLGLLCVYCAIALAQPASTDDESSADSEAPAPPSRAMLEFLMEFNELDDTEFDLLTAYAEKDADQEPQDSDNE